MYTILWDLWRQVVALKPAFISKNPHFNFITVHYFWIIGMAILGSICLYIRGNIEYIDALFLSSGAATQSGLNTVDINRLNTWQQIVVTISSMCCNPIAINTFVVFLRLYWFEKRFQHIAKEASKNRRSMSKTLSRSKPNECDGDREERGVGGRNITVLRHAAGSNGVIQEETKSEEREAFGQEKILTPNEGPRSSDDSDKTTRRQGSEPSFKGNANDTDNSPQPQIKFADEVRGGNKINEEPRMPVQRRHEDHIAFLERQRNPNDHAVLRIPGPRDADAGIAPQALDEDEVDNRAPSRRASTFATSRASDELGTETTNVNNVPPVPARRNITIAEPTRPPAVDDIVEDAKAAKHTLGILRFRKPRMFEGEKKVHEDKNNGGSGMRTRTNTFHTLRSALSQDKTDDMPYLSWEPTVGRNSAFVDLTEEQREELGGIEYRSLKSLALILTLYYWGFTLLGIVSLVPWITTSSTYGPIVTGDGQGRSWWGIFTACSAFTDLGFTLTPDSMISFQTAVWPLLLMTFLIIIGNTGFPIMLRIIIWMTALWVPKESGIWEELRFLLDHPRRCFTLLFPSKATWWLFWILVILNGLDLIFFIVLDLGNTIVTQLPINIRVLDGWFQAVSTRTAGFGVVDLAKLHPAIQVSYLIMMYISVLPIAISVRRTNVYEEKSLGIYGSPTEEDEDDGEPSYVGAHLRRQLSFDLWFIFLGFFIITISEGTRIQSGDPAFTMFSVLFEIVSAYGTVGLSLGYTNINASFSTEFGVIAKLVIIAMQIRGRHRGLPYELDRAILLPSENLQEKETHDAAQKARARRGSSIGRERMASTATGANKRGRSRSSTGQDRQPQNFLSNLLHPGPMMPSSHRESPRTDVYHERRRSVATTGTRDADRSVSPTALRKSRTAGEGNAEKMEGRRSFYQEDANPPPTSAS